MNSAGGFLIEHELLVPCIERIDGDIDSVMGMPLKVLRKLIDSCT